MGDLSHQLLFGQVLVGLVNGSFYALLSLGLAVIFGMLNIINFAHGAHYMLGAFLAWLLLKYAGISYWLALIVAPTIVLVFGLVTERTFLKRLYGTDPLYGLLFTFGLALVIQGIFRLNYGSSGLPYRAPAELRHARDLGFMLVPDYRLWAVGISAVVCFLTWYTIERTKLGSYLRASTENPALVRAFGVNVDALTAFTYAVGVSIAAFAGVVAAPIYSISPQMGSDLVIVVFAIVVIGGLGSILGSIVTGYTLGVVEGLTKVFLPHASDLVIFLMMIIILLVKPAGLYGRSAH